MTSRPGRIDLPTRIRSVIALDPTRPALQFEGRWRTWGSLGAAIDGTEAVLGAHRLSKATTVGVLMRNRPEAVRAVLAVLGTSNCLVALDPDSAGGSLASEIQRLGLRVIIASPSDWTQTTIEAAREAGSLGVALADDSGGAEVVVGVERPRPGDDGGRVGVAVQMLTSGTTGTPKRVDLLYSSLEHEIESTLHYTSAGSLGASRVATGVAILWNPILHIGGLRTLITNVVAGRRLAMLERFSVPAWVALIEEHRPKAISLVPSAMRMVLDAEVPREALSGVRAVTSGTAPLPPDTAAQFEETYGIPVLVVYGATEFAGGVAGWTIRDWREFGQAKRGSVGRPNSGIEVRIVDEGSGTRVPVGEAGLLEVRGAQLGRRTWLRTTDLARVDEDGFIWIEGRADDVINRGGFKVATGAVAEILRGHPAVLDACVIGLPDERLGTVPVAAVELRRGAAVLEEDLASWARLHLSGYQTPAAFRIVDALPRTPSMKVSQPAVRRLFVAPPASK